MGNYLKTTIVLLAMLIGVQTIFSQNKKALKTTFESYFTDVRNNKSKPLPDAITANANEEEVLKIAQTYFIDSLASVRAAAYYITKRIGVNSKTISARQKSASMLLEAIKDKDSGNSGIACEYLTQYEKPDFTPIALDSLRSLLRKVPPHYETILKLAGFLELKDMEAFIDEMITTGKISKLSKWAGHLALARMGNEEEISYCVERCKRIPVNDDVVYNLFPDMIYTRQKKAFDYLIVVLNSDEKNCTSSNPDADVKILCGYRIMEMLAPVIKDFPLKVGTSGDIKTDDYEKALKETRNWFLQNKEYEIDKDDF